MAVDPSSKKMGWALYENGQYRKSGVISPESFEDAVGKCGKVVDGLKALDWLVIEDTFYGKNIKTLKVLERFKAIFPVLAAVKFVGVVTETVTPNQWQSKMLGSSKNMDRKTRKQQSILVASDAAKKQIWDDNEADAVNIGRYFIIYGKANK